ncbi:hypothetical protein FRX31_024590, partial [Thalictrum thalictroides]
MAENKSEKVCNALVNRLQLWKEEEEQKFKDKLKETVETYTQTFKTKSDTSIDEKMKDKMTNFADNLDKQAQDIFATMQLWKEKEEHNFEDKLKETVETYTQTFKTKSDTSIDEKMTKFADNLDKQAEDIFAAKAKEVRIKVNLSSLPTEKSESAELLESRTGTTGTIGHMEYHVRSKESE